MLCKGVLLDWTCTKAPLFERVLYYVTATLLHRSCTKAPLFDEVLYYVTAVAAHEKELAACQIYYSLYFAIIKVFFSHFTEKGLIYQKMSCPCTPSGHKECTCNKSVQVVEEKWPRQKSVTH